jgi:hypothetical protein
MDYLLMILKAFSPYYLKNYETSRAFLTCVPSCSAPCGKNHPQAWLAYEYEYPL